MDVDFRVLGRLEVLAGGVRPALGGIKQRRLLALLLLNANRTVMPQPIIAEMWAGDPPPSALANVRTYIAGLRAALGSAAGCAARLMPRRPGYLLSVRPGELDLHRLEAHTEAARQAQVRGDYAAQIRSLDSALALWRGAAFEDVTGEDTEAGRTVAAQAAALEDRRLALIDERALARLAIGDTPTALGELRLQTARFPLRESSQALLMRAFYLAGDTSASLAAYANARRQLAAELGVEPGQALREVHRAVLNRDEQRLAVPVKAVDVRPWTRAEARCEVPAPPRCFVGREEQIRLARAALFAQGGKPAVVNFHGAAGSGTSALALQIAHTFRDRFPDGVWYADFGGRGVKLGGVSAAEVLRRLLSGLGVGASSIPADPPEAAALLRALLSRRQVLLVLDNAAEAGQVIPLLPAHPGGAVLVSGRRALHVLDGVKHVPVPAMPAPDAVRLLNLLAGQCRADPRATAAIAVLCAHRPLALRAAAARLAGRPDWTAADLVRVLADAGSRLEELECGGLPVRESLTRGYEELAHGSQPAQQRAARLVRLAGAAGRPVFSAAVAARWLAIEEVQAQRALDLLVQHQLVQPLGGEVFRMDGLTLLRARELAASGDRRIAR